LRNFDVGLHGTQLHKRHRRALVSTNNPVRIAGRRTWQGRAVRGAAISKRGGMLGRQRDRGCRRPGTWEYLREDNRVFLKFSELSDKRCTTPYGTGIFWQSGDTLWAYPDVDLPSTAIVYKRDGNTDLVIA
jgi:hypothetical protein